jgi:hypothetical protein
MPPLFAWITMMLNVTIWKLHHSSPSKTCKGDASVFIKTIKGYEMMSCLQQIDETFLSFGHQFRTVGSRGFQHVSTGR